jgi:glycogen phosphorylase
VKESVRTIVPVFSTIRMLRQYTEEMYVPAMLRSDRLGAESFAVARALSAWKQTLGREWHQVRIEEVVANAQETLKVGDKLPVHARVHLGSIKPENVAVEVYAGPVDTIGGIAQGTPVPMQHSKANGDGVHEFDGILPCTFSGRHGFAIRVVPSHADLADRYDQGLIVWG